MGSGSFWFYVPKRVQVPSCGVYLWYIYQMYQIVGFIFGTYLWP